MQIRVHPGTSRAFTLLRRLVRLRPITLGIPPQAGQCGTKVRGRICARQGSLERFEIHSISPQHIGIWQSGYPLPWHIRRKINKTFPVLREKYPASDATTVMK